MQSNLGSSSGLEFKRPDLDLLFRVAPLLSKWMNRRKPLFRATNHARNQSWTAPPFAFDLIVPPCKIIYAGITDSHNSLCALDSRGWSRDKWKLSLWFFRKICLNKRKEKIREMLGRLDNGNFDLDFLSFALERWYIYRRFESWMWWMEHGSKIIRSILDFASTFQQIDVQRGRKKELFSYSSLNIPKIKNPFIRTIIDPKKLFVPFRLVPFANIHRANVVSVVKRKQFTPSL